MKQIILKWLNNIEEQLKKSKEQIQKEIQKSQKPKASSDKQSLLKRRFKVARIDDGILCADIMTDDKDVVIRISGFKDFKRALDWAQLQSVLWKSDQQAQELLQEEFKPKLTLH